MKSNHSPPPPGGVSDRARGRAHACTCTCDQLPPTGFIRLPTVLQLIPVSRGAWWEGIREKRYPAGIKLGPRTTAWSVEAIRKLIADLAEVEEGSN